MTKIKHICLNHWHQGKGAKMVPFAGYDMPVQYSLGVLKEHLHTRSSAGLFDVSHMGQIIVKGEQAAAQLETLLPADLLGLAVGRQCYSLLLNEHGGVIDDLMICRRKDDFFLVVNAGCKENDLRFLQQHLHGVEIEALTDYSLLALQGPKAADVL